MPFALTQRQSPHHIVYYHPRREGEIITVIHIVKAGETLGRLAKLYSTTVAAIQQANNISETIYPGDMLVIPALAKPGSDLSQTKTNPKGNPPVIIGSPQLPSLEGHFTLPHGTYTRQALEDLCLLARLVYAEARGEPDEGQVAVAAVLLNRVRDPQFPNSIREAIYQPRQFEPVDNGTIDMTPNNNAYRAALAALDGEDPTDGALYFWNPHKVSPHNWVWSREITKRIGNHVFAK